ncbi:MAG: S8 family serine peptidase [Gemmatimonadota bacterium]
MKEPQRNEPDAGKGKMFHHGFTPGDGGGPISVLIELRSRPGLSAVGALGMAASMDLPGFSIDQEYQPVPMSGSTTGLGVSAAEPTYVVRGTVKDEAEIEQLRARSEIAAVWRDTPIAPFATVETEIPLNYPHVSTADSLGMAPCPIPPCDCDPATPKGTLADVAAYLGANQIWSAGFRGTGIVVGVVDSGITAQGRPVKNTEGQRRIPRVIDGWPADWGTESSKWGDHGNMCATDVLGMAPDAQLYDLRIAGATNIPGTISRALQAFQWCIDRHRVNGTPHVLTNSWGIFQESWDATYARDPNHPFTRKVVEAVNEGIHVLFAAGNCGGTCPDGRCGADNGPGRSIWGANGHPQVMTVGAVNRNENFVGYSSQGPAALDQDKPDFCSVTHFTGYFNSDSGTSAATPIAAGIVALLKQRKPALTPQEAKDVLKRTAKDLGPAGIDQHTGAGILRAKAAFDGLAPIQPRVRTVPLHRYWNPGIGDHFYTTSYNELGPGRYGWRYEGVQCHVYPTRQSNTVPLYRYWNPRIGDHFYTTSWNEIGSGRYGYVFEGIQCWVRAGAGSGAVALYRYWNARNTDHFYTTNFNELGRGRYGYWLEGVQCHVMAQPSLLPEVVLPEAVPAGVAEFAALEEAVPETFAAVGSPAETFEPEPTEFEEVGLRLVDSFSVGDMQAPIGPSFQTGLYEAEAPMPLGGGEYTPRSFRGRPARTRRATQGDVTIRLAVPATASVNIEDDE